MKFLFIFLFLIFVIDFIPASANLEQEIELLNKMSSEIQMMEEKLAKKISQAKEKDLSLVEGYLFYSGIKEKDGSKIGLGCILTLLELLHNRKVAFEYNKDLSRKLGLRLGKDGISISVRLSDF